jgi:hypothetical protein
MDAPRATASRDWVNIMMYIENAFFLTVRLKFLENVDRIRTRRTGSNSKGLDVGSCESKVSEGFLRQLISRMKREYDGGRDEIKS